MTIIIRRCLKTLIVLFLPVLLFAQDKDYRVLLNSGPLIPLENSQQLTKESEYFKNSVFGGLHYVVIQFKIIPGEQEKIDLANEGVRLVDYIPNYAYTATLPEGFDLSKLNRPSVRALFLLSKFQKTVPALISGEVPAHAVKIAGFADLTVITYDKMGTQKFAAGIKGLHAEIVEEMPMFRSFIIRIPIENINKLTGLPFVLWVEPIDPPNQLENLLGRSLHRVNVLNDGFRNLRGNGINVGIWDGGAISPHLDFLPAARLTQVEAGAVSSHSTHCSGTILGRGLIDPRARGTAPDAKLYSYNFNGNIQTEMAAGIPANSLVVSSHSYGSTQTCGVNGSAVAYSATSRATDLNLNNFPFHLHCHSAGNSQSGCAGGWSTITSSGKTAKNNILVANITTAEVLSGSSSCGPVHDGRVKPEISSFGTNVLSTYTPLNSYGTISGTSMATPGVAGAVTLLVERFKQLNGNSLPPSSLIKNTICNTAADLGNPGPDYRFGFGRINALAAVRILEQNRYVVSTLANGASADISINVPAGASRLRVMLTWNDPAATANASPALINNLDLSVTGASGTSLPWILDPLNPGAVAVRGNDIVSNIEHVTIDNPAAGSYSLRVNGTTIPLGPQEYALTWSIDVPSIEITYPNGGESFNPGSSETITWENAGISGTQLVEYSLDNGANWTTISASLPATTTRLAWIVPAGANTSTALIRVSSATLSDQSDANFRILGTVTNFSTSPSACASGQLVFTWTPVPNATQYDILSLDAATGQWAVLAPAVTGTTFTASGLVPNASMWFTIVSRSSTTGSVSERALAINRIVPNTGLSAIGSITGQNNLCGAATGVTYSVTPVTGATSYTWTVPPGASISGGQGTSTILVNYPAGSSNGNVTVFASAGTCQTPQTTLVVTIGSSSIAAPVSGGDQSIIHCDPNPIPSLTATATVPPGHTVVWYTSLAGGTVVANPVLNTLGTITYYAASINTGAGCESTTRTAIILTINSAAPANITATGPLAFCEGGNVILTASSGASYSWSNGATTQSITVTNTGAYSVSVSQVGGCILLSAPTTVAVSPLPSATVSASGPLDFCEGGEVTLTASGGSSYLWNTGDVSPNLTTGTSGSYNVTVTDANGCSTLSGTSVVAVSPRPIVSLTAAPHSRLYPGLSTTLTATVDPAGPYTYAWLKNGSILPGENTAALSIAFSGYGLGNYSVLVTNGAGCSNSASREISDSASNKLFIYPNPSTGRFQVVYYNGTPTINTVTVYDSKGARIFQKSYTISASYEVMEVDISSASSATYHLVLTDKTGKRIATAKVLVL